MRIKLHESEVADPIEVYGNNPDEPIWTTARGRSESGEMIRLLRMFSKCASS